MWGGEEGGGKPKTLSMYSKKKNKKKKEKEMTEPVDYGLKKVLLPTPREFCRRSLS